MEVGQLWRPNSRPADGWTFGRRGKALSQSLEFRIHYIIKQKQLPSKSRFFFQGKNYHCCLVNIAEHGTRQLRRSSCSHKLFTQVFNTGVRDAESGLQVCSAASAMTKAKTSPSPSRTSRLNLLSALATLPSGSAFFRRHFTG